MNETCLDLVRIPWKNMRIICSQPFTEGIQRGSASCPTDRILRDEISHVHFKCHVVWAIEKVQVNEFQENNVMIIPNSWIRSGK